VLGHIFNLPMPFVYYTIRPSFTAITVVTLSDTEGELVSPRFEIMNDARHIEGLGAENNI
jgi:probable phosphoglycerate mutase